MLDAHILKMFIWFVVPVVALDIILRGFALWKAAKLKEKGWFIALLILNTAAVLPAIYLILKRKK